MGSRVCALNHCPRSPPCCSASCPASSVALEAAPPSWPSPGLCSLLAATTVPGKEGGLCPPRLPLPPLGFLESGGRREPHKLLLSGGMIPEKLLEGGERRARAEERSRRLFHGGGRHWVPGTTDGPTSRTVLQAPGEYCTSAELAGTRGCPGLQAGHGHWLCRSWAVAR